MNAGRGEVALNKCLLVGESKLLNRSSLHIVNAGKLGRTEQHESSRLVFHDRPNMALELVKHFVTGVHAVHAENGPDLKATLAENMPKRAFHLETAINLNTKKSKRQAASQSRMHNAKLLFASVKRNLIYITPFVRTLLAVGRSIVDKLIADVVEEMHTSRHVVGNQLHALAASGDLIANRTNESIPEGGSQDRTLKHHVAKSAIALLKKHPQPQQAFAACKVGAQEVCTRRRKTELGKPGTQEMRANFVGGSLISDKSSPTLRPLQMWTTLLLRVTITKFLVALLLRKACWLPP